LPLRDSCHDTSGLRKSHLKPHRTNIDLACGEPALFRHADEFIPRVSALEQHMRKVHFVIHASIMGLRPESLQPLTPNYEEIGKAYMSLAERCGDRELQLICDSLLLMSCIAAVVKHSRRTV
jgi:hypothetical protein